ncbi:response regulator transcription factor [Verrucosispora sp. CWR15]|uniref:Response regulator transcription factor n=1 Tax=Verrucosispora sioxanthis TaxID=2499994 RepID=A0A6M1LBS6_9ACTN|nr:response regulator transcription factor [Verrucosispora sioxanthis]NEE66547.1 response regulator transcription factor [Verrucosispora sioxanthis]NGM15657.1 response regulator transcription factor [Verrucosispora sioxanthis]
MAEQPTWRAGLEKLAGDDPNLRVASAVSDVGELTGRFDLVVLDVARPELTVSDLIRRTITHGPVLVSADWPGRTGLMESILAGVRGCLSRQAEQDAVREAMRVTAQGGFYLCRRLADRLPEELSRGPAEEPGALAPREVETLRWIASGYTHSQIATRMGLSQATVNTYAKRIRAKLNAGNKAELTRRAIELGHLLPVEG